MSPPISDYGASTSSRRHDSMRRSSNSTSSSSKSKGKGRAIDEDVDDGQPGDSDGSDDEEDFQAIKGMAFCIRFTDGTTEDLLDLYVNNSEAIRDVKRRVSIM